MACKLVALLSAPARPFGPRGEPSAIFKTPLAGFADVGLLGIAGDEQGDRRHHGGPDKAIHQYPFEHYACWRQELAAHREQFERPGTFGENFSSVGMTEAGVCVGDVFRAGGAILEVSQGRQPCWKLDVRTGVGGMATRVQESARTGWYYRVLEQGRVHPADDLVLLRRPHPEWTLGRLLHYLYVDRLNREALAAIAALPALSASWRALAEARLRHGAVESWSGRLAPPS